MTASDHATKPFKNILRERGHPYMNSWCKRDGGGAADAALVGWRLATISGSNGR